MALVGGKIQIRTIYHLRMSILRDLISRIISISPVFFPKSFNKFAGSKQAEPPEKIYPISVASEQGLDTST